MIRRIKYEDIDFEKYSSCIESSVQRKYSATRVFLDVVSNRNWQILVFGDYEAVMPFSTVKKLGIEMVVNPFLCQQLGVFSKEDLPELNDAFVQYLNKYFRVKSYAFNDVNHFSQQLNIRKNYILFSNNYKTVYNGYSPKRRKKIKQTQEIKEQSLIKDSIDFLEAKQFIEIHAKGYGEEKQIQEVVRVYKDFYDIQKMHLYGYYYQEKLINLITAYEDEKTIVLLGTFNDSDYLKISGTSVLIDEIIKRFVSQKNIDFEGSEIPNIEEFFRGFRPKLQPYQFVLNSKKGLLKQILKRKFD